MIVYTTFNPTAKNMVSLTDDFRSNMSVPISIPGILFGFVVADEKRKFPISIPWYSIWHCTVQVAYSLYSYIQVARGTVVSETDYRSRGKV